MHFALPPPPGALATDNVYLVWNFAPWPTEDAYPDLPVTGTLPEALRGRSLLRVGPNPAYPPVDPSLYLWFDGDGMMNEFLFGEDGRVSFRNRYIHTARLAADRSAGASTIGGIQSMVAATTPEGWRSMGLSTRQVTALRARVAAGKGPTEAEYRRMFPYLNPSNTNVLLHADVLVTMDEAAKPYSIDRADLGTSGLWSYRGALQRPIIAHPIEDPTSHRVHTMGYYPFAPFVVAHAVDRRGRMGAPLPVDIAYPNMMHSFSVTEKRLLFYNMPLSYFSKDVGSTTPLRWQPELGTRVGVRPIGDRRAKTRWFDIDTAFLYHQMNAFDAGPDTVVMDVCRYPRAPIGATSPVASQLVRWQLDLRSGKCTETTLIPGNVEFPTIDPREASTRHTHGFAVSMSSNKVPYFDQITHVDLRSGALDTWTAPPMSFVGEAVFVAKSERAPMGDGWLLSVVLENKVPFQKSTSSLLVFDAMNVSAGPVAKVALPRRVPFDFHGAVLARSLI